MAKIIPVPVFDCVVVSGWRSVTATFMARFPVFGRGWGDKRSVAGVARSGRRRVPIKVVRDRAAALPGTSGPLELAGAGGLPAGTFQIPSQSPFGRLIRGASMYSACSTHHLAPGRFRRFWAT